MLQSQIQQPQLKQSQAQIILNEFSEENNNVVNYKSFKKRFDDLLINNFSKTVIRIVNIHFYLSS
jgi:hypothetical protein